MSRKSYHDTNKINQGIRMNDENLVVEVKAMVYSNARKLTLSAWLKKHREAEYKIPLKLQKFLFFYEAFSKVAGDDNADFDHLRGYKNGPVFSNVFGDYTKERGAFERKADACYELFGKKINSTIALQCGFMVATLSEQELSAITHEMNIWKSQEKFINQGCYQVSLSESDFNEHDYDMIRMLGEMYPVEMIKASEVMRVGNSYFVLNKADLTRLTEEHLDVLMSLTDNAELHNPVFVTIDEEGCLLID